MPTTLNRAAFNKMLDEDIAWLKLIPGNDGPSTEKGHILQILNYMKGNDLVKSKEISTPDSCLNKAANDEIIFVLRAKDPAAAIAILAWINERIKLGMNTLQDDKMTGAMTCMLNMTEQRLSGKFNEVVRKHNPLDPGPMGA